MVAQMPSIAQPEKYEMAFATELSLFVQGLSHQSNNSPQLPPQCHIRWFGGPHTTSHIVRANWVEIKKKYERNFYVIYVVFTPKN